MEQEIATRSLVNSLLAYNSRVQKLTRVQEKIRGKSGGMVSMRNALKLYQNYKAMEACSESLMSCIEKCAKYVSEDDLVVGRVGQDYLVMVKTLDGSLLDMLDRSVVYDPSAVSIYCQLKAHQGEFRTKQPVLALYPASNRMMPAQVSSPPSRRRKTNDYLVKFPSDAHSVPCDPKFVIDPNAL